jgi:hypothetical protein
MNGEKKFDVLNLGIWSWVFPIWSPLGPLSKDFIDNTKTRDEGTKRVKVGTNRVGLYK